MENTSVFAGTLEFIGADKRQYRAISDKLPFVAVYELRDNAYIRIATITVKEFTADEVYAAIKG